MGGWTKEELVGINREDIKALEKSSSFGDWLWDGKKREYHSAMFTLLAGKYGFSDTWIAGGLGEMVYYVGFWCGKDNDLICVALLPLLETLELDPYLSPGGVAPMDAINKAVIRRDKLLGGKGNGVETE